MYLCKVCKNGEIKFGTDFCEACRSFHKRHRNRTDFLCRSGTNDCLKNCPLPSTNHQSYRYLCQKCRIDACRKIKMAYLNGNGKGCSILQISCDAGVEMEKSIAHIQSAASILTESFAKIETKQLTEWPYDNGFQSYMALANKCGRKMVKLKEFSRQFPFFNNLDVSDRAVLFLTSRFKVFCGENLFQPDGAYVVDFKTSVAHDGGKFVPHLAQYAEQAEKTWNFMKNLNLDLVEKSFFLAFLHFGVLPLAMSSKGRRQLSKGLKQMRICFEAYAKSKYSKELWRQRTIIFYRAVDRVGEESLWRTNVARILMIPTLHQSGPTIFTSINNDEPEQYLTALKQRNNTTVVLAK